MAAPLADEMPPWRAALLAVPPDQRSQSQRDLIRGLGLAFIVKKELDSSDLSISLDSPRILKLLAANVEATLLGPFSMSALNLLDVADQSFPVSLGVLNLAQDTMKDIEISVPVDLPVQKALTAMLAFIAVSLPYINRPTNNIKTLREMAQTYLRLQGVLDDAEVDATLAAISSRLTAATLYEVLVFLLAANWIRQEANLPSAIFMFTEVTLSGSEASRRRQVLPLWRVMATVHSYELIYAGFEDSRKKGSDTVFGELRGSHGWKMLLRNLSLSLERCRATLERAVAAAEAAGDDVHLALAAGQLARITMLYSVIKTPISTVRTLLAKKNEALARAKSWLPANHLSLLSLDSVERYASTVPDGQEVAGALLQYIHSDAAPRSAEAPKANPKANLPLRQCAWCKIDSRECSACSSCRVSWYCGRRCQHRHWKSGHREFCQVIKSVKAKAVQKGLKLRFHLDDDGSEDVMEMHIEEPVPIRRNHFFDWLQGKAAA